MLKELAEYLIETGKDAKEYQVAEYPNDPDKSLVIGPEGVNPLDTPRQQPIRFEVCHAVEDFAQCLDERKEDLEPTIWYDESKAVSYAKDLLRRSSVSINFAPHPVLKEIATEKKLGQKDLIRFLRLNLAGMVEPDIITHFRQLEWDTSRRVKQTMQHSSSSLDMDVQASVKAQGADAPDQFRIRVPLFSDMRYRETTFDTLLAVDLDIDNEKIVLSTFPGTNEAIVLKQREAIARFLNQHVVDESQFTLVCGSSSVVAR